MQAYKGEKVYPTFQEPSSSVTGVKFGIIRVSDGYWFDFSDSSFKNAGWTTRYQTMAEDDNGLWIYAAGWTTPNVKGSYRLQFEVTDDTGAYYASGDLLEVTDITPLTIMTTPTPATKQEMLDAVNAAINAILTGGAVQSYSIGGRSLTRYSLEQLMQLRDKLTQEIAAADAVGARTVASFANPE